MTLTFQSPYTLWFLLIVPIIYYLYNLVRKKKKKEAIKFSHLAIIKKSMGDKKRLMRTEVLFYLSLSVLVLILIGLSDPHIPLKQTKEGVNVVLVIDDSGSMQATDYNPNRLEAAKGSAEILINSLKPKDHVGIVIFESGATTASYLTPFKDRAIHKLKSIKAKEGKTAIGDGLGLAVDMATSIYNKKKVVILLSDGVNNAGAITPAEAIQFAKLNKVQVYTIGMGSDGKVVLGYDWFGNPQYAELDEATLLAIASKDISEDIEREKEPTSIQDWFFVAAIIVLFIQIYMRYGRKRIIQ